MYVCVHESIHCMCVSVVYLRVCSEVYDYQIPQTIYVFHFCITVNLIHIPIKLNTQLIYLIHSCTYVKSLLRLLASNNYYYTYIIVRHCLGGFYVI